MVEIDSPIMMFQIIMSTESGDCYYGEATINIETFLLVQKRLVAGEAVGGTLSLALGMYSYPPKN